MTKTFFEFYIDRGGTFTDVFCRVIKDDCVEEKILKLLSEDPDNYSDAPREAIRRILFETLALDDFADANKAFGLSGANYQVTKIQMGTTVSTNALLERKGAKTAFLTSKGFKDLLEIGYQNRPKIFDLNIQKAKQVYAVVKELEEREYLHEEGFLDSESIEKILLELKDQGIESIAISLMHAYKNPEHELTVKRLAQKLGFKELSLSSELVPMIKYVPRSSTTAIDAYLAPVVKKYINDFKSGFLCGLKDTELLFMKSDGGLTEANDFSGYNSILSGPAGGVTALASLYKGSKLNPENFSYGLIGFDMGGTSTDVSRFDGRQALDFDSEIEGLLLQTPQLDINTIAAGGGSRLFYENGFFRVGPESAGSHPGPVSYKKGGYLTITDANLVLGKLNSKFFPKVFGPKANESLDYDLAYKAFLDLKENNNLTLSVEEIAQGFIQVANETMARPIREVSLAKGFDVKSHDLVCFGGAAAQHASAIAKLLGINKVIIHRHSGILSAYGISLARKTSQSQKAYGDLLSKKEEIDLIFDSLIDSDDNFEYLKSLNLRYQGTDTKFLIEEPDDYKKVFEDNYKREFGFNLDREIICEDVIVQKVFKQVTKNLEFKTQGQVKKLKALSMTKIFLNSKWHEAPIFDFNDLSQADEIKGPALIMQDTATIVVEPDTSALLNEDMNLELILGSTVSFCKELENNPINLAIFANRFMSIAEQMGKTLERTSISTNIKERRDFSCAIFNSSGDLIANAPHQPVHLGSMGYAVKKQIEVCDLKPGDTILTNHPVMGGSHLPDLTVISPYFDSQGELIFFLANRAHHADIGGISPGSMPSFSSNLSEEGIAIKSFKLVDENNFQEEELRDLFQESRLLEDNVSDLRAQVASNNQGIKLLEDLMLEYSQKTVLEFMDYIIDNSELAVRELLKENFAKEIKAEDYLDDGSLIKLKISIDKERGSANFDFTGSADEKKNNLNTPIAVVSSAVLYCLRAIIDKDIPLNQGFLKPIKIIAPQGSILNPSENAAVVAGNVQTSQRIVDVIFKAFGIVAASQGCMNNVIFGNNDFGYYETIGGGAGAGHIKNKSFHGASGVHTHMTNTRITDPEILESRYPVILKEFSIRENSGGQGEFNGGDGLTRVFKFLDDLELSLLTERRVYKPYGINGAEPGESGENSLLKPGAKSSFKLKSKDQILVQRNDVLVIKTPGGGGYN